jgi:Lambda phage tail tape-measure protein (Tape_meas_lam_C)
MSDFEVSINFTGDAEGAKDAANTTKEHVEKATNSLSILSDLVGVKIPDSVSKMLASSELIGPALEAAFTPLAIISLGVAIADVADKASKFAGELIFDTKALQGFENQIKADNKILEEYARKTKEATRALQLMNAPDRTARNTLKLQFQIEDQGGSAADFEKQLKSKMKELQDYMKETTTAEQNNLAEGTTTYSEVLKSETDEGIEHVAQLTREITLLGAKQKEVAAEEALTNKQNQVALDKESAQRAALASQRAAAAAQAKAQHDAAAAEALRFSETVIHNHSKILTAKQLEEQATKNEVTAEQAIALSSLATVKADEQQAAFTQKSAENSEKIAQLNRDIKDKQAEHNAALQVALGYTTQEKADTQALATLEKDKSTALTEANNRLTAQIAIVKQLGAATMNGMLGSPEQKAAFQKAALDYQKLKIEELNIEKKYDDQIAGLQLKLTNTFSAQFRKQLLSWQDINKELGQTFQSTLSSFNSALTSFVTTGKANWQQLSSSAISEIVKIGLQYAESQLLMEVMGKGAADTETKIQAKAALAKIEIDANVASANAYAPYAASPIMAGIMASAAGAAVRAFAAPVGAVGVASSAGGDWQVDRDRLNFVHANETILPAGIAGKLRNMVESGSSGGVTVVVNHSVNAIDSDSFQGSIRRHSNMIANEVTRALKRKGVK